MASLVCTIVLIISFVLGIIALVIHLGAAIVIAVTYGISLKDQIQNGANVSQFCIEAATFCLLSLLSVIIGAFVVCSLWCSRFAVFKWLLLLSMVSVICSMLNSTPFAVWMNWHTEHVWKERFRPNDIKISLRAAAIAHLCALAIELLVSGVGFLVKWNHSKKMRVVSARLDTPQQRRQKRIARLRKTGSLIIGSPSVPTEQSGKITNHGLVTIPLSTAYYDSIDLQNSNGRNFRPSVRSTQSMGLSETDSVTTPVWRGFEGTLSTDTSDLSVHRRSSASFVPLQPGSLPSRFQEQRSQL